MFGCSVCVDWSASNLEITIIYPATKYISGDFKLSFSKEIFGSTLKPSNSLSSVPYNVTADCTNVDN